MFFLGTTFFSARNTIDPSLTKTKNIDNITIHGGTYDNLYVSKNPNIDVSAGYSDWDFDTIMNANFDSTLDSGNSGFSLNTTDTILVRRREVGAFDWITIFKRNVQTIDDFKLNIRDCYAESKKDYEYMVVSVCNGIENSYVTAEVHSEFEGLYICDKNDIYGTILDLDFMNSSIETNGQKLDLLNSKYPTVVNNSISHYETGTISGTFLKFDFDNNEVDVQSSIQYRETVKRWLNNKKPKILKFYDGRIKLISINGTISDTADEHNDKRKLSFNWVEIGDVNDAETLYNNGLSDVGREWWY